MSVGLVHDYLLVMRGAERTFAQIAACWPQAPVYTTVYSEDGTERRFADRRVSTSSLQRLRVAQGWFRWLLPLYPRAVERLPVSEHELVVSSSSGFAHGVLPGPGATHVCYCHTPFRYAWHERARALAEAPRPIRPLLARTLDRIREWDLRAARRVTRYIANSELTRQRIGDFYGREATVVHPPVAVERFRSAEPADYFLVVSELVAHKRVAVALEAARRAGVRLKVAGAGPELRRLRADYGSVAEFAGRVSDRELAGLYARALALIVPNVEEFGIAAVEAQAAGRPVVALDAGGARETVIDGMTGVLVTESSVDELAAALADVDFASFSPEAARANAARFSPQQFRSRLRAEIEGLRELGHTG